MNQHGRVLIMIAKTKASAMPNGTYRVSKRGGRGRAEAEAEAGRRGWTSLTRCSGDIVVKLPVLGRRQHCVIASIKSEPNKW